MTDQTLILSVMGQAALEYAARGWHVFPIKPGHKGEEVPDPSRPDGKRKTHLLEHGHLGASCDPAQIRKWWTRWPDANIGLHLAASGLVAVDVDLYKSECGWRTFSEGLDLPETLRQRSARGGVHYLFLAAPDEAFDGGLKGCPGVEIKHKGYILLEPSTFEGGRYEWQSDDEPVPAPLWVPRKRARTEGKGDHGTASPEDRAKVLALLGRARNTLSRDDWVDLGNALKGTLGGAARAGWIAFHDRYEGDQKPGEAERFWDSAKPDGSLGLGTIFHLLRPLDQAANLPLEASDDFDLSHDALATDLGARSWDLNAKHVAGWGQWLFWAETHWARDTSLAHLTRARAYLNTRASELATWAARKAEDDPEKGPKLEAWAKAEARTLRHASTVAAVVGLARSNRASAATPDDFDQDPLLLGTPGGTVDLRTGQVRAGRREDHITRLTSVAPVHGQPARWLALLDEIFQGDRDLIAFMQRAAGYSLTGETSEHKLLFPYGTGANGKSTVLETLLKIWGDYARRIPATSLLNSTMEKHPTDLAGLRGARLAVGSELPRGKSWDESAIKDMTGGDMLTARFMRQDFFDFRPQFTLWIAGNTMPSFRGVDEALRRRVVLIPFTVTIPPEKRDPELPKKLMAEAGQILAWAIEGAMEWQRRGLDVPASVAAASKEYMDGEDTIAQFLADRTVGDAEGFVTSTALFLEFKDWLDKQGLVAPWSVNTLSKELKSRNFAHQKRKHGAGFLGLRLA